MQKRRLAAIMFTDLVGFTSLLAKILLGQKKNKAAREHLTKANLVWENADEAYEIAQEAKSLLLELGYD